MRHGLLVAIFFVSAPAAHAAPSVSISPSGVVGQAPFAVTLTAVGAADSYAWDLGDGTHLEGPVVQHVYASGRWTATLTATQAGESARAQVTILAAKLSLSAPAKGTYGRRVRMSGRITPGLAGATIALRAGATGIATARTDRRGRFHFRPRLGRPVGYQVAFDSILSNTVAPAVRPRLNVSIPGSRMIGQRLVIGARLRPADAGLLQVRVWRGSRELAPRALGARGRIRLPTGRATTYVLQITVKPTGEFTRVIRTLRTAVHVPYLSEGARGPSVRILERRLRELSYALRDIDGLYTHDTTEAVLTFQKLHGQPRTGRVGPALWARLRRASRPRARYRGTHLEVNKGRQILFDVRRGRVFRTVHVSTGATGNTPVGRWHIYRKSRGWDWVLWYPMYFLRGFAVHGYPSVPAYPASHGCVRVPMWIAPSLFAAHPYGQTIYVY
jgi:Putative peptidoglycan binding domain/L,D-transpeptidase catalytic domain/PKD domain